MSGRLQTHWHECWRYASHYPCAIAEIERLRAEVEALCQANARVRQENALLRKKLDEMGMDWSTLQEGWVGV